MILHLTVSVLLGRWSLNTSESYVLLELIPGKPDYSTMAHSCHHMKYFPCWCSSRWKFPFNVFHHLKWVCLESLLCLLFYAFVAITMFYWTIWLGIELYDEIVLNQIIVPTFPKERGRNYVFGVVFSIILQI